jgi:hypothetical protein
MYVRGRCPDYIAAWRSGYPRYSYYAMHRNSYLFIYLLFIRSTLYSLIVCESICKGYKTNWGFSKRFSRRSSRLRCYHTILCIISFYIFDAIVPSLHPWAEKEKIKEISRKNRNCFPLIPPICPSLQSSLGTVGAMLHVSPCIESNEH